MAVRTHRSNRGRQSPEDEGLFRDRDDVDVRFDYRLLNESDKTYKVTPLILAAALGKSDIVQELLN
jgi:hypothetical protein